MSLDPLVQQLKALLDESDQFHSKLCGQAGISRNTLDRWLAGSSTPNIIDFTSMLEVLGYTLTIQRMP